MLSLLCIHSITINEGDAHQNWPPYCVNAVQSIDLHWLKVNMFVTPSPNLVGTNVPLEDGSASKQLN